MTELIPACLYRLTGDREGGHHNSYALINDRRQILLFDAIFPAAIPALSAIIGLNNLVGVVLTHRHVAAVTGRQGIEEWRARFGKDVPLFLTTADAQHRSCMEALPPYDQFIDPATGSILKEFGIETIPFPGHTEGSCLFYYQHKKMIFTGDCCTGPKGTSRPGQDIWVRPPSNLSGDDDRIRSNWKSFLSRTSSGGYFGGRPVRSVLPGHGQCILDKDPEEVVNLLSNLLTEEKTPEMDISAFRSK